MNKQKNTYEKINSNVPFKESQLGHNSRECDRKCHHQQETGSELQCSFVQTVQDGINSWCDLLFMSFPGIVYMASSGLFVSLNRMLYFCFCPINFVCCIVLLQLHPVRSREGSQSSNDIFNLHHWAAAAQTVQ